MNDFLTPVLTTIKELGTTYIFKIIFALIIIGVGFKLIKVILKIINKMPSYAKLDEAVRSFLNSFIKIALYAVIFITAATELGVPATSFVTMLASCGLAIGLALQGSLTNLAGGLMILIFKPFKMGDYIISGGFEGTVKEINVLYTVLSTPDNKTVTIPNGTISNSPVTDVTGNPTRRLDFNIGVGYDSDTDKVIEILLGLAEKCAYALKEPAPAAKLVRYGDSSIEFTLRIWVNTDQYWDAMFFLNENLKKELDAGGIEIPFPQMDVHLKNN